ncbi:Protein of unknown function [Gryllus bimaculatus]|nr:Protein of unknown function [Gryllus bimaculatus]
MEGKGKGEGAGESVNASEDVGAGEEEGEDAGEGASVRRPPRPPLAPVTCPPPKLIAASTRSACMAPLEESHSGATAQRTARNGLKVTPREWRPYNPIVLIENVAFGNNDAHAPPRVAGWSWAQADPTSRTTCPTPSGLAPWAMPGSPPLTVAAGRWGPARPMVTSQPAQVMMTRLTALLRSIGNFVHYCMPTVNSGSMIDDFYTAYFVTVDTMRFREYNRWLRACPTTGPGASGRVPAATSDAAGKGLRVGDCGRGLQVHGAGGIPPVTRRD